jgi:hypothetical protein
MHTSSSFALAENREVSNTIAHRHYAWIEAKLRENGVEASPYNVAVAWNAGVNAVIRGNAPTVAHDYASRVMNIAATLRAEAPAAPAPEPEVAATTTTSQEQSLSLPFVAELDAAEAKENLVVAAEAPTTTSEDSVNVRYYADPILLALNRTTEAPTPSPSANMFAMLLAP